MNREREKAILKIFKNYKANKKELEHDYNIPVPSGVAYDKICIQRDTSKNVVYEQTVSYISKRENLFKQKYIVDETLNWFKLEGHGRERFITMLFIDCASWTKTEMECHISKGTIYFWRREVLEKAEMIAKWVNYF